MAFNFKTATPDTSIDTNAFMFGADSQSAATPSIYSMTTVKTFLWDSPTLVTPNIGIASGTSLNLSSSKFIADANGNVTTTRGFLASGASGAFNGTYSDGVVIDYVSPTARFSAGSADGFAWYNNGIGSVSLMTLSATGALAVSSLALGGASIGTNALAVTGTSFLGNTGIGAAPAAGRNLEITANITGSTTGIGVRSAGQIQTDVTSQARYFTTSSSCAASTTLPTLIHYYATQGTFGSGSTITAQYGYHAESTLTGATNNYGFYSNIATASGRWNFYANGTAPNYFAGICLIGTTASGASKLVVNDTSIQINLSKTPASASDTGTTGQICWDSSYVYVCVATNTWKRAAIATW